MIIVTGGTHGIGAAVVIKLSQEGRRVLFTGRDEPAGQELSAQTGAIFLKADAANAEEVASAVDKAVELGAGRLEGLVNNAGTSSRASFLELPLEEWDRVMGVNLRAVFTFTQRALPALRESGVGSVVNVASIAGKVGEEGLAAYCASKGGVIALTQALALEFGDRVRFNAVCPGQISTRMMSRVVADEQRLAALTRRIPAGRLGEADEVANTVSWLLSHQSSFVNGAVLSVDGGETAGYRTPPLPNTDA
jgi:NAD(P)-dependent dehydrogenase (short-subunit alcohol dehydrogenase family)